MSAPPPPEVLSEVRATLGREGRPASLAATEPVGGGCVNPAVRVRLNGGASCFLKWNAAAPAGMFEAEAEGLEALAAAARPAGLRVPAVLGVGGGRAGAPQWLLLEYLERGSGGGAYAARLGRGLAALHRNGAHAGSGEAAPAFGWRRDNYIGTLPQANPRTGSWATFWVEARLEPQLSRARLGGRVGRAEGEPFERLLAHAGEALAGVEGEAPSLLHGDLWSGNAYPAADHAPVLIDPAVYLGHREVDLAMAELFGGFPSSFLDAYREAFPLREGYERLRRPLYQLYYLLVHVNLFGRSYLPGSLAAARTVLAEL